jgi:hypothetical protein
MGALGARTGDAGVGYPRDVRQSSGIERNCPGYRQISAGSGRIGPRQRATQLLDADQAKRREQGVTLSVSQRFTDDELQVFLRGCTTGTEYWQPHPDYADVLVSNLGGVQRDGVPLKRWPSGKGGYPAVMVRGRRRLVHHLVLETFISHRPPGLETCHWDGRASNACLMNIRWDTHLMNMADRRRHVAERRALAYQQRGPTVLQQLIAKYRTGPMLTDKPKRWREIRKLLQLELESVP